MLFGRLHTRPLIWISAVAIVAIFLTLSHHRASRMDPRFFAISPPGLWGLTLYLSGQNLAAARAYRGHWNHGMAALTFEDPEVVALARGDLESAEQTAKARLSSSPGNTSALLAMAEVALARRTPQQALAVLERVQDPDAVDALFLRSFAHAQTENYDEAINWANRAFRQWERNDGLPTFLRLLEEIGTLENRPEPLRPFALLAQYSRYLAELDPGQRENVLRYAELAIRRGDHAADAYVAIGAIRHRRRQREAALAAFLKAVDIDPRHGEARRWAALSYSERGDVPNEYRMAKGAHDSAPGDPHYLFLQMTVLIHKLGDYRTALDVIHTTYADRPLNWQAHMWLGHIHSSLGQHAPALDNYRAAAALRSDSATAQEGAGLALAALGRHDEAVRALQRALAIAPWSRLHFELGGVYRMQRKYGEALREYEAGISRGGATVDQHTSLCLLYAQTGANDRAVGCYEAVLATHPDDVGARRALGFIRPGVTSTTGQR